LIQICRRCPNCKIECKLGTGTWFDEDGNIFCSSCELPILAVDKSTELKVNRDVKKKVVTGRSTIKALDTAMSATEWDETCSGGYGCYPRRPGITARGDRKLLR